MDETFPQLEVKIPKTFEKWREQTTWGKLESTTFQGFQNHLSPPQGHGLTICPFRWPKGKGKFGKREERTLDIFLEEL